MKTVVLEEPGQFHLTTTEPPDEPDPGEAIVRVHRVGICGTDLHAFRGKQTFFSYPRILGHELGVEIVDVGGNDSGLSVGDRCAVEPYLNCGRCIACRRGKSNCCVSMQVLGVQTDGGMRELIAVPVEKLHKSETLPVEQLALVEMLCIGAHAVTRAQLEPDECVLIIGAGPIGLSIIQFAQIVGTNVIAMEIIESRLEFARRQLGVEFCIDGKRDPLPQLQEVLGGDLPTAVFDATGNAQSMMNAFNYVAHGGRLIFVGHLPDDITFHDPDFHQRELTLMASRNATGEDFAWVIEELEGGAIDLGPWITHRASPKGMLTKFRRWLEPETKVIKAMLEL